MEASQTSETSKAVQNALTWKQIGADDLVKRKAHTSVLLGDLIVTVGGIHGSFLNDVVAYDIVKNTYITIQPSGTVPSQRAYHTACHYKDKTIIVYGGFDGVNPTNETALLTITDDQPPMYKWETVASDNEGPYKYAHTANIYQGKMYVFAGFGKNKESTNDLWTLDLENFTWTQLETTGDIPFKHYYHSSIVHGDNLYIFGGYSDFKPGYLNDLYVLNLKDLKWKKLAPTGTAPSARWGSSAFEKDGKLYVFGGGQWDAFNNNLFAYDFNSNTWEEVPTDGEIPTQRSFQTHVIYQDKVVVWGGSSKDDSCNKIAWLPLTRKEGGSNVVAEQKEEANKA